MGSGGNWKTVFQVSKLIKAEVLLAAVYQYVLFMIGSIRQEFRQNFRVYRKIQGNEYPVLIRADVAGPIYDQEIMSSINESNPVLRHNRLFL